MNQALNRPLTKHKIHILHNILIKLEIKIKRKLKRIFGKQRERAQTVEPDLALRDLEHLQLDSDHRSHQQTWRCWIVLNLYKEKIKENTKCPRK